MVDVSGRGHTGSRIQADRQFDRHALMRMFIFCAVRSMCSHWAWTKLRQHGIHASVDNYLV
jgi:hypothetical protein